MPGAARLASLHKRITSDPMERYFRLIGYFDSWEKKRLMPGIGSRGKDPLWLYRRFYDPLLPEVTSLRLLDIHTYLVDDILTKVDRASMSASLEARPPLLDHTLVEFLMTIPAERIAPGGSKKGLMKDAMRGILPDEIIDRSKRGFSAPIRHWLRHDLATIGRDRVINGFAARDGLLDGRAIESMLSNATENRWAKLWSLLMFEGWYRRWVRGIAHDVEREAAHAGA
jgi:asparagine synthase (glutamine-hydrolysing)